jgi:hypothetical protein
MSVPSYTYKCSKCDFSAPGSLLTGLTVYEDGEQHIQCHYEACWCNKCVSITPLENFKANKSELEKAKIALNRATERTSYFWQNILNALLKYRQTFIKNELNEITASLKYMELANNRMGDEKCLKCGSNDATPLPDEVKLAGTQITGRKYSENSPTGFIHPHCGGEIIAVGDDMRFNLVPSTNIYSMDGSFKEKIYH